MKYLLVVSPPGEDKKKFEIKGKRVGLGRSPDNNIHLPMKAVSSAHLEFRLSDDGGYEVEELGSTNGTRLNGKKLSKARIEDGDRLLIGETIPAHIEVVEEEASAAPAINGATDKVKDDASKPSPTPAVKKIEVPKVASAAEAEKAKEAVPIEKTEIAAKGSSDEAEEKAPAKIEKVVVPEREEKAEEAPEPAKEEERVTPAIAAEKSQSPAAEKEAPSSPPKIAAIRPPTLPKPDDAAPPRDDTGLAEPPTTDPKIAPAAKGAGPSIPKISLARKGGDPAKSSAAAVAAVMRQHLKASAKVSLKAGDGDGDSEPAKPAISLKKPSEAQDDNAPSPEEEVPKGIPAASAPDVSKKRVPTVRMGGEGGSPTRRVLKLGPGRKSK